MEIQNMYSKGKIYKIVNDVNDEIYVGSTCKLLSQRMALHRSAAKQSQKFTSKVYQTMREFGIEHFYIILVEAYPCASKDELRAREHHLMIEFKPSLNMIGAVVDIERQKKAIAIYHEQNKEHRNQVSKLYRANNTDKVANYNLNYYKDHKAEIKERVSEWGTTKVRCDACDIEISRGSLARHSKTKNHIANSDVRD